MSSVPLPVQPLEADKSLADRVYQSLKQAIMKVDLYSQPEEPRLDERRLAEDLGVSRTPIREAISRLEQEGFVRTVRHRGVFIIRRTKGQIVEMITVWAALESMAARLITLHASTAEIATLRRMFATFEERQLRARIDEYSETNIAFHQNLLAMAKCGLLFSMADNLFAHVRSIRKRSLGEDDRVHRSIIDHMHIIEALEARDTEAAERLVREHTLNLAAHVERHAHYLG